MTGTMKSARNELAELVVLVSGFETSDDVSAEQAAQQILTLYTTIADVNKGLSQDYNTSLAGIISNIWRADKFHVTSMGEALRRNPRTIMSSTERAISWTRMQLLSKHLQLQSIQQKIYARTMPMKMACDLLKSQDEVKILNAKLEELELQTHTDRHKLLPKSTDPKRDSGIEILGPTCLQCVGRQDEIDQANARAEACELKEAASLVAAGKYQHAAVIYEELRKIRCLEISRKKTEWNTSGAEAAELQLLDIKFGHALMLKQKGDLGQADDLMTDVLEGRKKILRSEDCAEIRTAQLELCSILRDQNSSIKRQKAKRLYRAVWDYHVSGEPFTANESWTIKNGHELGLVLAEQGLYEDAWNQHEQVLEAKKQAFGHDSSEVLDSAVQLATIQLEQFSAKTASETVAKYFLCDTCTWSPEILSCATRVGGELSRENQYQTAEPILHKAWVEAEAANGTTSSAAFDAGWWLSWSLYQQGSAPKCYEAKEILHSLLLARKGPAADTHEALQLKSLLAWICRKVNEVPKAHEYAEAVWNEVQDENVLGDPSLSMGQLLIWILFRAHTEKECAKGALIWTEVWNAKRAEVEQCCHSKASHRDLAATAKSWRTLADDLDAFAKKRQATKSKTAEKMRLQAQLVESHCARNHERYPDFPSGVSTQ